MDDRREDLLRRLAINDERAVESVLCGSLTDGLTMGLDAKTIALVRLAGLVACHSTAVSCQWAVTAAYAAGAVDDEIIDVLTTLAPVVGATRVEDAARDLATALGVEPDPAAGG